MTKKIETRIHRANGGNHSPVNYRKHKNMLLTHPYAIGLLFHIVLTGSEDRKVYRKAVELLCKQLRAKGMPCRYKACYERDKFKRFHKHVFLLIEAKHTHPNSIIHYSPTGWFTKLLKGMGLGFNICAPEDVMHYVGGKKVNYAYVPKKAGSKLQDCLEWISYLTKVRSKAGVEGQIYTASTNREPKPSLPAALPAAEKEAGAENQSTIDQRISETPNLADAFSAVSASVGPKGSSASGNSRFKMERTTDIDVGSTSLISNSRRSQWPLRAYEMRYVDIESGVVVKSRIIPAREVDRTDMLSPLPPYRLPMGRGQRNTNRQGTI